jgi:hypothetical protein
MDRKSHGPAEDDDAVRLAEEFAGRVVEEQRNQSKESWGWWATWVWIASGVFLFVASGNRSIFSLSALVFILIGMFFSAAIFGMAFQALQNTLAWIIVNAVPHEAFRRHRHVVGLAGQMLLVAQIVVTFLAARWCFQRFPAF